MSSYIPNLDENILATVKDEITRNEVRRQQEQQEISRKELLQQKHYYLLSELQKLAREVPGKLQQRLPYDLLCSLANSLLDGTVCEIVRTLKDVQQMEEQNLFSQRNTMTNEHKIQKKEMQRKHREALQDAQAKPHNIPYLQAAQEKELQTFEQRCEEESKRRDMKTILALDQQVMDQQVTLEKAGVPGFFVTNNPSEIRLQMNVLDFIIRISQQEAPR